MAIYQEGKTTNKYENFKATPPRKKPKEISARRYLEGRSQICSSRHSEYDTIINSSNSTRNLTDLFNYGLRGTESPYITRQTDSPYIEHITFENNRKNIQLPALNNVSKKKPDRKKANSATQQRSQSPIRWIKGVEASDIYNEVLDEMSLSTPQFWPGQIQKSKTDLQAPPQTPPRVPSKAPSLKSIKPKIRSKEGCHSQKPSQSRSKKKLEGKHKVKVKAPYVPGVANWTDHATREATIDNLLQNKNHEFTIFMKEFLKRSGYKENDKLFIINSQDDYIRRALNRLGWIENKNNLSNAFHLKWIFSDTEADYKSLKTGQMFNHFPNNRDLTTKSGLCNRMRGVSTHGVKVDEFFLRWYDIGDKGQLDEFVTDYERTEVMNMIKKHAEFFLSGKTCMVNINCLHYATKYCIEISEDDNCESPADYSFIDMALEPKSISPENWSFILEYCKLQLPIRDDLSKVEKLKSSSRSDARYNWAEPSDEMIKKCIKAYYLIKSQWPQWDANGYENIWIVKPGQNSKGSGVYCINTLEQVTQIASKMKSRIVQKYLEAPLLINGGFKFDIRQWVLVTSQEPMQIYMFDSCYLRLCSSMFSLEDLDNKSKHLANFTVQKQTTKNVEQTVVSLSQFQVWLTENHPHVSWNKDILPKIHKLIIHTINTLSESENQANSQGCFELFGFDIIIDESFNPWLLEVNLSPACTERTSWLSTMLDSMSDGLLEIVLSPEQGGTPLYTPEFNQQRKITSNHQEWVYLYASEPPPDGETTNYHKNLQVIGSALNLRRERKYTRRWLRTKAATKIQKVFRGYSYRNEEWVALRDYMSVEIQRHIRGFLGKRRLYHLQVNRDSCYIARAVRQYPAKQQIILLKKTKLATRIAALFRGRRTRRVYRCMLIAHWSRLLAWRWRTHQAKNFVLREIDIRRKITFLQLFWRYRFRRLNKFATVIQKVYRAKVKRRYFASIQKIESKHRLVRLWMKGYLKRKITKRLQTKKALKLICRRWSTLRAHRKVAIVKTREVTKVLWKNYKQVQVRKFMRIFRSENCKLQGAITKIQAKLRQSLTRKMYVIKRKIRASKILQKHIRAWLARVYVGRKLKELKAAIRIQSAVRKFLSIIRVNLLKHLRYLQRKHYEEEQEKKRELQRRVKDASRRLAYRPNEDRSFEAMKAEVIAKEQAMLAEAALPKRSKLPTMKHKYTAESKLEKIQQTINPEEYINLENILQSQRTKSKKRLKPNERVIRKRSRTNNLLKYK